MKIIPYSEDALATSLANDYTLSELIKAKNHFSYLKNYFGADGLNAKTIVIEEDYISKDFLHDYASYYALCFAKYPKVCKRVHFFDSVISEQEFKEAILKHETQNSAFWKHYIGFIVVKPIPGKVIGYSVLRTYSTTKKINDRNFWGTRDYTVHLFGNKIELNSLAFQEQDTVLAACATTAIWSMLNKAAVDFHTILKSPSEITKDAANLSHDGSRLFPNKGLDVQQICQAIFNSGLVSEVKHADITVDLEGRNCRVVSNQYLKKIIGAYSPIGVPIILVIKVPSGGAHGLHAITVSGFKSKPMKPEVPKDEIYWMSDNIDRLYAHDDQWGPFARINLKDDHELETPWTDADDKKRPTMVTHIIVPVYPKIRIGYEDIEIIVHSLHKIIRFFLDERIKNLNADLVWEIKIDYSEKFKSEIKDSSLDDERKIKILGRSLPKYIWIASCYIGDTPVFSFAFDATDVNTAELGLNVVSYIDEDARKNFVEFLELNKDALRPFFQFKTTVEALIRELS